MLMTVDSTDKTKIVQVIANLEGLEGSHAEREQSIVGSQPIETTEPARPGDNPETAPSLRPPGHEFVDVCKASGSDFTMHNAVPTQRTRLHRESQEIPDHSPPAPLKPFNNQLRTSMTPNSMEKEVNSKKQMSLSSGKRKLQLSEDDLFEQLIGKIRQREESEKMAANLRRHVETENQRLREVNHTLQDRVKNYQVQLVEISSENKGQRAHIDQWKAKLGTFRRILNEIGREYDKVRQQTKDVREAAMSLGREKVEIKATLDDLKMQVSNQAATIEGQRNKISTSEGTIVALREALEHSEKRGDLIKAQLFSEKKRIVTLENYIQNESQSQARYLTVVKKEQNKMSEKLDSMYDLLSKFPCETQDTILSKIRPEIERCVVCFEELKKQSSSEMMNVESFTSSVQEAASQYVV
jgi:chromosome segregation ATPase